jgi:hypothetical protein
MRAGKQSRLLQHKQKGKRNQSRSRRTQGLPLYFLLLAFASFSARQCLRLVSICSGLGAATGQDFAPAARGHARHEADLALAGPLSSAGKCVSQNILKSWFEPSANHLRAETARAV